MSRFFQGATRGHGGVRAHDSCRSRRCLPPVARWRFGRFILTITGIIASLNPLSRPPENPRLDSATRKGRSEAAGSLPQRPGLTGGQGRWRRRSGGAGRHVAAEVRTGWVSWARRSSWGWQIQWGRTGGAVGPCPSGGGAVFQCRTLEWVVRNIPQKNRHYTHQWTRLRCETSFRS